MIQELIAIPNYNFELDRYPHETSTELNWKQRLSALEPQLIEYFKSCITRELEMAEQDPEHKGMQIEDIDGRKMIFGNGARTELINAVVNAWKQQGCPLINLNKWVDWAYQAAEKQVIAEFSCEA